MSTCKDCIHYDICLGAFGDCLYKICDSFKDSSKFIELPCSIGDTVYMINSKIDPYDGHEYYIIIKTLFSVSILHLIGRVFFLTREETEKKLEELNHDN